MSHGLEICFTSLSSICWRLPCCISPIVGWCSSRTFTNPCFSLGNNYPLVNIQKLWKITILWINQRTFDWAMASIANCHSHAQRDPKDIPPRTPQTVRRPGILQGLKEHSWLASFSSSKWWEIGGAWHEILDTCEPLKIPRLYHLMQY